MGLETARRIRQEGVDHDCIAITTSSTGVAEEISEILYKEAALLSMVTELGNRGLDIPQLTFPLDESTTDALFAYLQNQYDAVRPSTPTLTGTVEHELESFPLATATDHFVPIAAGLYEHDLRGKLNTCGLASQNAQDPERESLAKSLAKLSAANITVFRLFSTAAAYLATGNKRYITQVDSSALNEILCSPLYRIDERTRQSHDRTVHDNLHGPVDNRAYLILHQLTKNARSDANVTLEREEDYDVISVSDTGEGIKHHSEPLPAHRLGDIFKREFSTTGGGLGLTVVKAMLDRINANTHQEKKWFLTVTTTVKGSPTQMYNLQSGEATEKPDDILQHGTTFKLYIPKQSFLCNLP